MSNEDSWRIKKRQVMLTQPTWFGTIDNMKKLPIFLNFSGNGGVEQMVLNLIRGFGDRGVAVELLAASRDGKLPALEGVRVMHLGRHTRLALPALVRYLRTERPPLLFVAKDRAIRTALLARRLAAAETKIVGRLGTHLSQSLRHKSAWQRKLRCLPIQYWYPKADRLIAVSHGVAEDLRKTAKLSRQQVTVIRNPTITPEVFALAEMADYHPWLDDAVPVLLGVGRLTRQKGFDVLLKAFAQVRRRRRCRLLILGEGRQRSNLQQQAHRLGIDKDVAMPGFSSNPYAAMRRADLFVLPSRWEGSPNVLIEALALQLPVVAADCPSGPREILKNGAYGPLVPVEDADALASAIIKQLQSSRPREDLPQAVADYTLEKSADTYLQTFSELI